MLREMRIIGRNHQGEQAERGGRSLVLKAILTSQRVRALAVASEPRIRPPNCSLVRYISIAHLVPLLEFNPHVAPCPLSPLGFALHATGSGGTRSGSSVASGMRFWPGTNAA